MTTSIPTKPVVEEWLRHHHRNTQVVRIEDAEERRLSLCSYQEDDPTKLAQWLRDVAEQLPSAPWETI